MVAGGATFATPYVWSRPARAARQVVVRNAGGAYDETQRKYIYNPFTKETGIEVVAVASTLTKMLAMVKAGNTELNVADAGFDGLLTVGKQGALAPIDFDSWKYTDPKDVSNEYRTATTVGLCLYATVLGYNKEAYPEGKQPKSWAEFWDVEKFPGSRMLADMASGAPNLEFALIADGVPMDKIIPIDVDRAFKAMSKIKPHIKKFWDTGALSAQMLAERTPYSARSGTAGYRRRRTKARRWRSNGTSTCCRSRATASSRTGRTRRRRSSSSIMR